MLLESSSLNQTSHTCIRAHETSAARLAFYKEKLEKEQKCDLVVPLCHLYESQDEITCRNFDFPVILSGHDHHVVDRTISGTRPQAQKSRKAQTHGASSAFSELRLLKPGSDARFCIQLDLVWDHPGPDAPLRLSAQLLDLKDFTPNASLADAPGDVKSGIRKLPRMFRSLHFHSLAKTRTDR